jgi:predicted nuclease of predicted toxin-antitoxin system
MPDPDILRKAVNKNRVLLTHDLDFSDLLAVSGAHLPSVIIFRLRNMRPERVNHFLRAVLDTRSDALNEGAVVSITEGQARVRSLPLDI